MLLQNLFTSKLYVHENYIHTVMIPLCHKRCVFQSVLHSAWTRTDILCKLLERWAYIPYYTLRMPPTMSVLVIIIHMPYADPHQMELYKTRNTYLPALNGITSNGFSNTDYRTNFIQIERLVMIGGPHDGVITPWQSRWERSRVVLTYIDDWLWLLNAAILLFMVKMMTLWSTNHKR